MAHFARIDDENNVLSVIVVNNSVLGELEFPDSEPPGVAFCKSILGDFTHWKQTSYNRSFRKNYAAMGDRYDPALDAFIPPQPYPSWVLDEATCQWAAPFPYPQDGGMYQWDECQQAWVAVAAQPAAPAHPADSEAEPEPETV